MGRITLLSCCALLIVLVQGLFAAQAPPEGTECSQCTITALCSAHLAVEQQLVAAVKERFEAGSSDELRAFLDRLLDSEREHMNVPSPSLARFLAQHLEREQRRIFDAEDKALLEPPLESEVLEAPRFRVALASVVRCNHPDAERAVHAVLARATPFIALPKPASTKAPAPQLKLKNGKLEGMPGLEKLMKEMATYSAALAKHVYARRTAHEALLVLVARRSVPGQAAALEYCRQVAEKRGNLADLAALILQFDCEAAHQLVIQSLRTYHGGLAPELSEEDGKVAERLPWGARIHQVLSADAAARGLPVPVVTSGDRLALVWRKWLEENREKIARATEAAEH